MLNIHTLSVGPMGNLVYIIADSVSLKAAVIDPAWDVNAIVKCLNDHHYSLDKILLTHAHFDHVNVLIPLLSQFNVPTYVSAHETEVLMDPIKSVQFIFTEDKDVILLGELSIKCIYTPGHTPGGQCFYSEPHLFTGDTLFVGACGRCDFPYSDLAKMYQSLSVTLASLPEDTVIYPGHDYGETPTDTIGHQKKTNPYMKMGGEDRFSRIRSGV